MALGRYCKKVIEQEGPANAGPSLLASAVGRNARRMRTGLKSRRGNGALSRRPKFGSLSSARVTRLRRYY